jgi:starvation-inducible DNA-binding protein
LAIDFRDVPGSAEAQTNKQGQVAAMNTTIGGDWNQRNVASGATPAENAITAIEVDLQALLADVFTLYLKSKNFHWHMSGPHFRDYHLLLDEQAEQLFAMTDDIAERARKLGAKTIRSVGDISRFRRLDDSDEERVPTHSMLRELYQDNQRLKGFMCVAHTLCDRGGDIATASLLETWIDQTERRAWFLAETLKNE